MTGPCGISFLMTWLVTQVPIRGVRTVCARVGDLFAYLAVAGLALLAAAAIRHPPPKE